MRGGDQFTLWSSVLRRCPGKCKHRCSMIHLLASCLSIEDQKDPQILSLLFEDNLGHWQLHQFRFCKQVLIAIMQALDRASPIYFETEEIPRSFSISDSLLFFETKTNGYWTIHLAPRNVCKRTSAKFAGSLQELRSKFGSHWGGKVWESSNLHLAVSEWSCGLCRWWSRRSILRRKLSSQSLRHADVRNADTWAL